MISDPFFLFPYTSLVLIFIYSENILLSFIYLLSPVLSLFVQSRCNLFQILLLSVTLAKYIQVYRNNTLCECEGAHTQHVAVAQSSEFINVGSVGSQKSCYLARLPLPSLHKRVESSAFPSSNSDTFGYY